MKNSFVIIDENDKYFVQYDDTNNKILFRKDIVYAKFYKEKSEAIFEMNFLSNKLKKANKERNLKLAEVKFKITILD